MELPLNHLKIQEKGAGSLEGVREQLLKLVSHLYNKLLRILKTIILTGDGHLIMNLRIAHPQRKLTHRRRMNIMLAKVFFSYSKMLSG